MKSQLLKMANYVGEAGLFRYFYKSSVPVFMLHRVSSTQHNVGGQTIEHIGSCLEYLKKNRYKVFTLSQYFKLIEAGEKPPSKACLFTIDDGFIDHHDNAGRIFDFHSYPLNFFLITGFMDKLIWPWDDQVAYVLENTKIANVDIHLPDKSIFNLELNDSNKQSTITALRDKLKSIDQNNLYEWLADTLYENLEVSIPEVAPLRYSSMSWRQARSLAQRGHELYPHTHTHRILSSLSQEQQKAEIQTSINRIKEELRFDPNYFAYPTGRLTDYDTETTTILKSLDIHRSFNTVPGYVTRKSGFLELPRFSLPSRLEDFKQIVNKFEAFKESIRH